MKIFISSLINGMTEIRQAAREAVEALGHEAVMAEDFAAGPLSPQVACLSGLRNSAAAILILGHEYGAKQASGLSATHEEYRDAKGQRPVIAFRQEGHTTDPDQAAFIKEVEGWEAGLFRGEFASAADLGRKITRSLHEWEVSRAASPLNADALVAEAVRQIPQEERGFYQTGLSIWVSVAAGPRQSILRPSEIEQDQLSSDLLKEAMFGPRPIFNSKSGSDGGVGGNALTLSQGKDARLRITTNGDVLIGLPASRSGEGFIVIEETATKALEDAIGFSAWVLDRLDPTQRITTVAIAAALGGGEMVVWRSQAEHDKSPNSYQMGMGQRERKPVHLSPAHKPRTALKFDRQSISEDLITLIRRQVKGKD